ncbi:MAG: hypothetical protein AB8B97_12670 [Granulosicoccus sp.]
MIIAETILLLVAYSTILIAIFVSIVCYKRNMEKLEEVTFAISLLLLIVAISTSQFSGGANPAQTTSVFVLLSMIMVGLTTMVSPNEKET